MSARWPSAPGTIFEFESHAALLDYQREYPQDPAAVSLGNWAEYESRHPGMFAGMYQFWVVSRP